MKFEIDGSEGEHCREAGRSHPAEPHAEPPEVGTVGAGQCGEAAATGRDDASAAEAPKRDAMQPRRRFSSLATFVAGQNNRLAVVSAEMVARNPGQITPLFIHGPTSVGKTHLLEGIWTATRKSCRGDHRVYLSAEQFTSQFLEALRGSGLPSFRRKYRGVGLLIVDDLQFLAGKRATQVELLHTIDTLMRDGRQMVFAADRPPAELVDLGSGVDDAPGQRHGLPDRPARVRHAAGDRRAPGQRLGASSCPPDVQRFVASRLTAHARELSGALCRLQAASEAFRRPITLELAEEALCEMIHQHSRVVRLGDIQKAVCHVFGLDPASLQCGRQGQAAEPSRGCWPCGWPASTLGPR